MAAYWYHIPAAAGTVSAITVSDTVPVTYILNAQTTGMSTGTAHTHTTTSYNSDYGCTTWVTSRYGYSPYYPK